jgi:hypothetical protein
MVKRTTVCGARKWKKFSLAENQKRGSDSGSILSEKFPKPELVEAGPKWNWTGTRLTVVAHGHRVE